MNEPPPMKDIDDWAHCCDECTDGGEGHPNKGKCSNACYNTRTKECWLREFHGGMIRSAPGMVCGSPQNKPPDDIKSCCCGLNKLGKCKFECESQSQRLSWGTMVCAVLLALALVYLGVGSLVTRSRGNGWLPHRTTWTSVWGLVWDGITWTRDDPRLQLVILCACFCIDILGTLNLEFTSNPDTRQYLKVASITAFAIQAFCLCMCAVHAAQRRNKPSDNDIAARRTINSTAIVVTRVLLVHVLVLIALTQAGIIHIAPAALASMVTITFGAVMIVPAAPYRRAVDDHQVQGLLHNADGLTGWEVAAQMAIHGGGRNLPKTSAEPLLLETNMQPAVREAVPPPAESKRKGAPGVSGERAVAGRALPLHIAASSGDVKQMAACILSQRNKAKSKALLDGGDHRQYTPFHMACAGGHVDCVRLLLDAGCDTALRNDEGLTGWELAAQLQRTDVLALQQEKVSSV